MRPTINQLPQYSGEYILTISRFNEEPIERHYMYSYEKGTWLDIYTNESSGNTDKVMHEGEYWNIHSFRNPDQFDLN